jgi:hypothetical protein
MVLRQGEEFHAGACANDKHARFFTKRDAKQ